MTSLRHVLLGALLCVAPFATAVPIATKTNSTASSQTPSGKYIVTLMHGLTSRDLASHVSWVNNVHKRNLGKDPGQTTAGVDKTFDHLSVYVGEFDNDTIKHIRSSPDVEAVEPDQLWELYDATSHPPGFHVNAHISDVFPHNYTTGRPVTRPDNHNHHHPASGHPHVSGDYPHNYTTGKPQSLASQPSAPWNLARLSHRTRGAHDYVYDPSAGRGTYAYVIDTGLNTAHEDFSGRATLGYNAVPSTANLDTQGHGTHTAGIIAGSKFGVAKAANVVGVKVFDTGGSLTSVILDGYNWAVADIKSKGRVGKSVINMSLGGGTSAAFNNAVQAAYRAGIPTVVAAGNQGRDVGSDSPASAPDAITVGAIDSDDRQAGYSNFGRAVDIYAPGSNILSTWIGGSDATNTMSGTSMACPHVSGLVLYIMAKDGLSSPADIVSRIKGMGIQNAVSEYGAGSPNLLAYNGS